MHPNEIVLVFRPGTSLFLLPTAESKGLMEEARTRGPQFVEALQDQTHRQVGTRFLRVQ